jgi:hypothetical protein
MILLMYVMAPVYRPADRMGVRAGACYSSQGIDDEGNGSSDWIYEAPREASALNRMNEFACRIIQGKKGFGSFLLCLDPDLHPGNQRRSSRYTQPVMTSRGQVAQFSRARKSGFSRISCARRVTPRWPFPASP